MLGVVGVGPASEDEHAKSNLPDVLARWRDRHSSEMERAPTEQSFCVPKADIVANDYDLSINRYGEIVFDEIEHPPPERVLHELSKLEEEIVTGIDDLRALLS